MYEIGAPTVVRASGKRRDNTITCQTRLRMLRLSCKTLYTTPVPRFRYFISLFHHTYTMPPRIASKILSKRKFDSDNDEGSQASTKKAKIKPGPNANGQPTNTTLPEKIVFLPKSPKSLRIVTWNIVSLASSLKKGSLSFIAYKPAIILIPSFLGFEKYVNAEDAGMCLLALLGSLS
jgi:hypothetical protein